MSFKDEKNLFANKVSVTASGDVGNEIHLAVPVDFNKNGVLRVKCIYNEAVAGGTGAGHRMELMGAGADKSYDTLLAVKEYAAGSEPGLGESFNLMCQEAEGIEWLKAVCTNTTGNYATGKATIFLTID